MCSVDDLGRYCCMLAANLAGSNQRVQATIPLTSQPHLKIDSLRHGTACCSTACVTLQPTPANHFLESCLREVMYCHLPGTVPVVVLASWL